MISLLSTPAPLRLPQDAKGRIRTLLLAKHARGDGLPDAIDGNHATYHHELRTSLEAIGLQVTAADTYEALYGQIDADFVVPLLNRGGFQNSEILAPLLLARAGVPFLGATPIIRGLADDKHLMKLVAHQRGVKTADWMICRFGAGAIEEPRFRSERLVVKPNASSASWGVAILDSWAAAKRHIEELHAARHDVIVEPWLPLLDVAVPVIGARGPWLLPPMAYEAETPGGFRTYVEKRGLAAASDDPLTPVDAPELVGRLREMTLALVAELWPFDYGRFEFRHDPATGALSFMEVNLSCNLWSKKTISRAARLVGLDHVSLVETIVAHSMARQGLLPLQHLMEAA